ncbi:MAG: T9SS type A sorting domain-containing protein [Owenweeksia sp.]|nr:T9SS type A sorting domain-containing protein [Owenweeksia sp.]
MKYIPILTSERVSISFEPQGTAHALIRLSDLTGREIIRMKHDDLNGKFKRELSLESLAKGVYLIEVKSGDLRAYRRVILE